MEKYLESIKQADSLDQLDQITEAAAMDDTLTGAEYEAVYAAALHKAQTWDPQNRERREHPAQAKMIFFTIKSQSSEGIYYLCNHWNKNKTYWIEESEIKLDRLFRSKGLALRSLNHLLEIMPDYKGDNLQIAEVIFGADGKPKIFCHDL